ncbi:MAG: TrbI/VirB10 family protein [Pseudomonadota bacterium]
MTETTAPRSDPPKVDPETLVLNAAPRRVVRFKRRLLIGIAAVGCAAVFGVTWLALKGPAMRLGQQAQELYNTERKPTPDGLAALPGNYGQMRTDTPQLGPPLPGDLGRPILERQRQLGLAPGVSMEEQAAQAERQRLAQQARQAREAGVFFQIANRAAPAGVSGAEQGAGIAMAGELPPATDANRLNLDPDRDQNNQQRKLDFLNQPVEKSIYNPHALQTPASPYQVMAGSIIAASLVTGLNSDLPGLVVAQVTENVYDSVTGRILLIPQGARLIGSYDSVVAFGQSRALVVWRRIVLPDGSSVQIDNLPATDAAGYAGLEDEVDYHTWRLLKGVALSTLLGVGTELSLGGAESDLVRAIRQSTQQSVNQAGQRITEKNLNIQPTITIRPGWPLRVIVYKDLVLRPYRG